MDSRTAAHVLDQIGALLELTGAPRFNARAYQRAGRAILALGADDVAPLLHSGELRKTPGVGPATVAVIKDLVENGESSLLARLAESTPPGLIQMARVPGLGLAKVRTINSELGIEGLDQLGEAARDGRLAKLKGFGPKTAERVLAGIDFARDSGRQTLYHRGLLEAVILRDGIMRHPDVTDAVIAGTVRRHLEIIGAIDIVAVCATEPSGVARAFANQPAVKEVTERPTHVSIRYIDDTCLDLWCVRESEAAIALWRATGSAAHVTQLEGLAGSRGYSFAGLSLRNAKNRVIRMTRETDLFAALGLEYIPPELREGMGEIEAAASSAIPDLITSEDIKGALHCHSTWSDGSATIEEMARAARERGWRYIGITDHSQAAFYAGGMRRDEVMRQHEEIDELNSRSGGFRILKGIECDILPEGRLDYDDETLDTFDYIIGSVHSQFRMSGSMMTKRVLAAMDDPRMTILGHATGRLLLSRRGYEIDVDAVIEKAAGSGTMIELNCDPHRMDLDWRQIRDARNRGVMIEIGPDAHSERELDNVESGVGMARKAWLTRDDVLNTRTAAQVLKLAKAKRSR